MEVTCLDETDSPPRFLRDEIDVRLSESFLPGRALGSVSAKDPESAGGSPAGGLTYALGAEAAAFMDVDPATGALTLRKPIDRETQPELEVEVRVTDGVHEDVWRRTLAVEDMNDNAPAFDSPYFSFDVPETASRGAVVGRIRAADPDAPGSLFSRVSYRLVSEYGSDTFRIDPDSGVITLAGPAGGDQVRLAVNTNCILQAY